MPRIDNRSKSCNPSDRLFLTPSHTGSLPLSEPPPSLDRKGPPRPLLLVTLEGLSTAALGCYGSSWNATPAIDAIAAGGCTWDRWIATSDRSDELVRRWFTSPDKIDPLACWKGVGPVTLISDDPAFDTPNIGGRFDDTTVVAEETTALSRPASDLGETSLAKVIATAMDRDQRGPWSLMWIHSRFLTRCWDAPRDLFPVAEEETSEAPSDEPQLLDEPGQPINHRALEPLPPIFDQIEPPQIELDEQSHPDLIFSWMRTYGCQIRLFDLLLEVLLQSLSEEDPQLIVAGTSGMPLGQNGWIGPATGPLRSSGLRLPLIVSDRGPVRSHQLTSSDQMAGLITDLCDPHFRPLEPSQWSVSPRQGLGENGERSACVKTDSARAKCAITHPRWQWIRDCDGSDHLFLKPDDQDDVNDVGRLREDVIEQLSGYCK